jgi:hypothetical protein
MKYVCAHPVMLFDGGFGKVADVCPLYNQSLIVVESMYCEII